MSIKIITIIFLALLVSIPSTYASIFQTGDIIFQQSKSPQSIPIQKATNSIYSHMGMIVNKQGEIWVLAAI